MALHPVLEEKLNAELAPGRAAPMTRRDVALPEIPGKVHAVSGMRRAGKTIFQRQLVAERQRGGAPERALYPSFDDGRLADIAADQLGALLEELYRRHPQLRRRSCAACSTARSCRWTCRGPRRACSRAKSIARCADSASR